MLKKVSFVGKMIKREVSDKFCVINYMLLCKKVKQGLPEIFWDEFNFLCKRLKIAKFFILKRSKKFEGHGDYRPG